MQNIKKSCIAVSLIILPNLIYAVTPVVDATTNTNTYATYIEALRTAETQIDQYATQIQQYNLQIKNSNSLSDYLWSDANQTITDLIETIDTLSDYDLEPYLEKFQDVEYYMSSPCFSSSGCTVAEMEALYQNAVDSSASQKDANDAMIEGLVLQQSHLQSEVAKLESLQTRATTAEGQMAAIQYANQIASNQAHQLMQIRGLLIAQQTAEASRAQMIADKEAQQQAASQQLRAGTFAESPDRDWLSVMP